MIRRCLSIVLASLLLTACAGPRPEAPSSRLTAVARSATLRIASWNLEFLAAANGSGCNPRQDADYARMRAIADGLNADVIAFEEAESVEAAARVFDPAHYKIVMEARPGKPGGACSAQQPEQIFIRQAVGFAIRRGLSFNRSPDLTDLEVGNDNLRSGVDITVMPTDGTPLRLLVVHLKSGCFQGTTGAACPQLLKQIPVVAKWIDDAATGPTRFAVLGDWNRRLALPGDSFWKTIDDANPPNADLRLGDEGVSPKCDPKFTTFIDHIVLDKRAGAQFLAFKETTFPDGQKPSDHCPIIVDLQR
jgi:endonuclease/exonuclease/phosphatase family metal-dependent hydrolase